jgi:N-acetylglucosaminyl-diphospho-decaprenol L-rhamnosyltransferase
MGHQMAAQVVIVTHDAPLTKVAQAVESVIAHTPGVEIHLVHNGRDPAPLRERCQMWPEVRLISTVNRGYAAAVNLGMSATTADKVMVLNDDVEVTPQWWSPLADALDHDAGLGAVMPLMLLASEGEKHATRINSAGVHLGTDAAGMDIGYSQPVETAPTVPTEIAIFSGGAVMLRRAMWQQLAGMQTCYFLYYEDVDLALRGAEAGWRYQLIPESKVIHAQGSTTSHPQHAPQVGYLRERNRLWIAWRFGSGRQMRGALWLSIRRLRHPPRRIHAQALGAGLLGAPQRLRTRWIVGRTSPNQ